MHVFTLSYGMDHKAVTSWILQTNHSGSQQELRCTNSDYDHINFLIPITFLFFKKQISRASEMGQRGKAPAA